MVLNLIKLSDVINQCYVKTLFGKPKVPDDKDYSWYNRDSKIIQDFDKSLWQQSDFPTISPTIFMLSNKGGAQFCSILCRIHKLDPEALINETWFSNGKTVVPTDAYNIRISRIATTKELAFYEALLAYYTKGTVEVFDGESTIAVLDGTQILSWFSSNGYNVHYNYLISGVSAAENTKVVPELVMAQTISDGSFINGPSQSDIGKIVDRQLEEIFGFVSDHKGAIIGTLCLVALAALIATGKLQLLAGYLLVHIASDNFDDGKFEASDIITAPLKVLNHIPFFDRISSVLVPVMTNLNDFYPQCIGLLNRREIIDLYHKNPYFFDIATNSWWYVIQVKGDGFLKLTLATKTSPLMKDVLIYGVQDLDHDYCKFSSVTEDSPIQISYVNEKERTKVYALA